MDACFGRREWLDDCGQEGWRGGINFINFFFFLNPLVKNWFSEVLPKCTGYIISAC